MVINERARFERVFCPTDLSPESNEAIRYSSALAEAFDARLIISYCDDPRASQSNLDGRDEEAQARLRNRAASAIKRLVGAERIKSLSWDFVITSGAPSQAIPREAARQRADLIVIRSRRRPDHSTLLGSVSEAVCRKAPCPVLVTHPGEREWVSPLTGRIDIKQVLVAYDFSSDSELSLSYGLSFAHQYGADLRLVHILPPRPRTEAPEVALLPLASEDLFHRAMQRLESAIPSSLRQGIKIDEKICEGLPYREVLALAEENEVDLICMGASGTGFGMRALFGSNADRVLRQAPCPVLIARPLKPLNVFLEERSER
jgi:nucleotide-binding universal stress UspA family protein